MNNTFSRRNALQAHAPTRGDVVFVVFVVSRRFETPPTRRGARAITRRVAVSRYPYPVKKTPKREKAVTKSHTSRRSRATVDDDDRPPRCTSKKCASMGLNPTPSAPSSRDSIRYSTPSPGSTGRASQTFWIPFVSCSASQTSRTCVRAMDDATLAFVRSFRRGGGGGVSRETVGTMNECTRRARGSRGERVGARVSRARASVAMGRDATRERTRVVRDV